jgi:hypothetical protein
VLTNEARWVQVKRLNYCTNCLSSRHTVKSCRAADKNITHYSIKLNRKLNHSPNQLLLWRPKSLLQQQRTHVTSQQILLSTVMLVTYNSVSTLYHCRAILDSGSQLYQRKLGSITRQPQITNQYVRRRNNRKSHSDPK